MSKFAVMVFTDERKAYEGLHALRAMHADGTVTLWGTAVVRREPGGTITILEREDEGALGTGLGALAGGLAGLFGGPAGAAVGLAVGAAAGGVGDLVRLGLSDEFLDAVERDLAPGRFAVIADLSEEWVTPLDTRIEELGAKVVRENRLAFEEGLLEERVRVVKARLGKLKAERAQRRAERSMERAGAKAAEMERMLADEIEYARRSLEYIAESSGARLESTRQELDAKVEALLAQASGATPEVRAHIERRIAEVRREFALRDEKLARASELTREALRP